MAVWSRLTGAIAAIGIGGAGSAAVNPVLEVPKQKAWAAEPNRILGLGELARLVATGLASEKDVLEHAHRNGYQVDKLRARIQLELEAPPYSEVLELWRRNAVRPAGEQVSEQLVEHALAKAGIEPQYWAALKELLRELLSVSDVANAVQQGHMPNPGILPDVGAGTLPPGGWSQPEAPDGQPPSEVPLTTIALDPLAEAEAHGLDVDRLRVLANLAGLPPGAESLLEMWNRNLITEAAVDAGIREGHLKTKWSAAFKRLRWAVLPAQEYANAALRAWIKHEDMYEGGKLTGHTAEQMDLLFRNRGRTATPRQLWLAWARKVVAPDYPDRPADGRLTGLEDHELAIARSDIQPWYAKLLWDVRFNYPPLFQLNRLVQSGAIDADTAALWASYNLEAPEVIEALRKSWSKPRSAAAKEATAADEQTLYSGARISREVLLERLEELGYNAEDAGRKVDVIGARLVSSARTTAIGDLHTRYRKGELRIEAVTPALAELGLDPWIAEGIAAAWLIGNTAGSPPPAPAVAPPQV